MPQNDFIQSLLHPQSGELPMRSTQKRIVILDEYVSLNSAQARIESKEKNVNGETILEQTQYIRRLHCSHPLCAETKIVAISDKPCDKKLIPIWKEQKTLVICTDCLRYCSRCKKLVSTITAVYKGDWLCLECEKKLFWDELKKGFNKLLWGLNNNLEEKNW